MLLKMIESLSKQGEILTTVIKDTCATNNQKKDKRRKTNIANIKITSFSSVETCSRVIDKSFERKSK